MTDIDSEAEPNVDGYFFGWEEDGSLTVPNGILGHLDRDAVVESAYFIEDLVTIDILLSAGDRAGIFCRLKKASPSV
jgi:hypothetical protein